MNLIAVIIPGINKEFDFYLRSDTDYYGVLYYILIDDKKIVQNYNSIDKSIFKEVFSKESTLKHYISRVFFRNGKNCEDYSNYKREHIDDYGKLFYSNSISREEFREELDFIF